MQVIYCFNMRLNSKLPLHENILEHTSWRIKMKLCDHIPFVQNTCQTHGIATMQFRPTKIRSQQDICPPHSLAEKLCP
uniref:Uncharacterized protein n=1 Tax=Anguilla anguilla TaxID=7936 RepID=A0A0E9XP48_ANGAN